MKKRILSVLLGCSLFFGTVFANAVSIEFEDLEQNNSEEQSMIEEVIIDENSISSEATNKNGLIETFSSENENEIAIASEVKSYNAETLIGFFTEADNVIYNGEDSVGIDGTSIHYVAYYSNTSIDNSKYVLFSNAVNANNVYYDLVLYPFKVGSKKAEIVYKTNGYKPGFYCNNDIMGCKIVITEHGNINKPIKMNILLGVSDLDKGEYIAIPTDMNIIHQGLNLNCSYDNSIKCNKYVGIVDVSDNKGMYNTNCILGQILVPESGITIYYGTANSKGASLSFKEIQDYINLNAYTIRFDANRGDRIPPVIIKYGNNTSTVLGNIGNTIPTRNGYTFKGWSASPKLNDKRIAYTAGNTGATQTSNSWTYADYCNYTGGDSSNRTLTLYAQWEADTNTVTYDGNGNTGGSTASQTKNYDIVINLQQNGFTKTGYHFTGWNTSVDGSGTSYDAGASYNINANVTLYAQWEINTSTIKINPNGGSWNGNTATQSFTQDYNSTKLIPVPTRNGYAFVKWNKTGTNGTMSSLTSDSTYTFGASNGVTDTLTAEWKANDYNIFYDLKEGSLQKENPSTYNIETDTFTLNNPTKTGYTFIGWTGSNGTTPQKTVFVTKGSTGDKNYTANWQINQYTVNLIKGKGIASITGNGTYDYDKSVTINATLLPGYAWGNWTGTHSTNTQQYTFKMPASNVTDTANATPIVYNITYNLDGSSLSKENPKTYTVETDTFKLNNPTKTGYTFLGWTGSNGTPPNKNVSVPKGSIEDKTYTANWKVNQYPVTYIDVDSEGNEIGRTTKMVDYGISVRGGRIRE